MLFSSPQYNIFESQCQLGGCRCCQWLNYASRIGASWELNGNSMLEKLKRGKRNRPQGKLELRKPARTQVMDATRVSKTQSIQSLIDKSVARRLSALNRLYSLCKPDQGHSFEYALKDCYKPLQELTSYVLTDLSIRD